MAYKYNKSQRSKSNYSMLGVGQFQRSAEWRRVRGRHIENARPTELEGVSLGVTGRKT